MNVKILKCLVDLAYPNLGKSHSATISDPEEFFKQFPRNEAIMKELYRLSPIYISLLETADTLAIGVNKPAFEYFNLL